MKKENFTEIVQEFHKNVKQNERFSSFDYCYNYFKTTSDLEFDIEKSCLELGSYLASWGMYRGSTMLLQKSVKFLMPTIEYIVSLDSSFWNIDVDVYNDENVEKILTIKNKLSEKLNLEEHQDVALTTKIMLGVFGFIPAFDSYFCNTFRKIVNGKCGFRSVNKEALKFIQMFYENNKEIIDNIDIKTFDFTTGEKTNMKYPKAKIIDMYGFQMGFKEYEIKKQKSE